MKKKYVAYVALLTMSLLLFTGCDALISNVFKTANLGQPSAEKIKEENTASLLEQSGISSGSVSNTFINTVISDESTKTAVIATLQETVTSGSPTEAQAAQALILDIKLADIGADEVISNLNGAIGQLANLGDNGEINSVSIIDTLLPDNLSNNTTALAEFIDNLNSLGTDVDTLATKISDNSGAAADGLDVATMAQTAAIVKFVNIVEPATGYTAGEAIANAVADLKTNSDADVKQYFSSEPDMASLGNDATLQTLFTAAGMGDLLSKLSNSGN